MDPCRPSPWGIAEAIQYWAGANGGPVLDSIIDTRDLWLIPKEDTADNVIRLEMAPRLAMQNRKVFGHIGEILEKLLGGPRRIPSSILKFYKNTGTKSA